MSKFRKKPVEIEAVQLCWRNWSQVCDLLGDIIGPHNPGRSVSTYSDTCGEATTSECGWIELTIPTLEGDHVARHGDFIIRGVKGEFYPCKPDIFAATYDQVVAAEPGDLTPSGEDLAGLSAKATKGPWFVESERSDGAYGSGEDVSEGYDAFAIRTEAEQHHGSAGIVLDSLNSTVGVVEEEHDEDTSRAWDATAKANAHFVVAVVNAYREGRLTPAPSRLADRDSGDGWSTDMEAAPKGAINRVLVTVPPLVPGEEPTVGEAWYCTDDRAEGWWWSGTSPDDPFRDPIHDTNAEPVAWRHLPKPFGHPIPQAGERVRHVKRGSEYEVLGEAEAQIATVRIVGEAVGKALLVEGAKLTVYRGLSDGKLWCRFTDEFRDGRFVAINATDSDGGR